jgi:hypothetical protein
MSTWQQKASDMAQCKDLMPRSLCMGFQVFLRDPRAMKYALALLALCSESRSFMEFTATEAADGSALGLPAPESRTRKQAWFFVEDHPASGDDQPQKRSGD